MSNYIQANVCSSIPYGYPKIIIPVLLVLIKSQNRPLLKVIKNNDLRGSDILRCSVSH